MSFADLDRAQRHADVAWTTSLPDRRDYEYGLTIRALLAVCERQQRDLDYLMHLVRGTERAA